jgi:hypothetical protein
MPTTIATLGRERTVATLARRLYQIEGRGSAALQHRAEAALLAANPRLSSAEGFRSGERVVVPAVPGLTRTEEVTTAAAERDGLTVEAALRLHALGSRIEDRFRSAADNRRQTRNRLDDQRFLAEARAALPESVELISKARDRLEHEERQAQEMEERLRKSVAEAIEGLEALENLARG